MKIDIKSTNIELTEDIKKYILEKIDSLEKFIKSESADIIETFIEVGKPSSHHKSGNIYFAQGNIILNGEVFRGEIENESIEAAIDELKNILQRKLKDFKGKKETLYRRSARKIKKLLSLSPLARFRKNKE